MAAQTFSLRIDEELLARIDAAAAEHTHGNRTAYILSWLPEYYEPATTPNTPPAQDKQLTGQR